MPARRLIVLLVVYLLAGVFLSLALLVLVPLLRTAGVWPMVALILGSLALVIAVVLWLGPEGRSRRAVVRSSTILPLCDTENP